MKITVLTICPEMFGSFLESHVVRKAGRRGAASVSVTDIRDYAGGSFRHIDDSPFGGGRGMVLRCGPVLDALQAVRTEKSKTVVLSPAGTPFSQRLAEELSREEDLVLVCGHYEGFDARILEEADLLLSLGDYVLTGGELPAMVVADAVLRLLPGVLKEGSAEEESFGNGLLEYPQYTQPQEFRGKCVPEVLLSGDHARIRRWRLKESLRETLHRRPDLLEGRSFTEEETAMLEEIRTEEGQ